VVDSAVMINWMKRNDVEYEQLNIQRKELMIETTGIIRGLDLPGTLSTRGVT